MEDYCKWLEMKMEETIVPFIQIVTLVGLNPTEVIHEMARRNPRYAFGWKDYHTDLKNDQIGAFFFEMDRDSGHQCIECQMDRIVWSDVLYKQCPEHCDHPLQQCRGGCDCTCDCCAENGFLSDSQEDLQENANH